VTHDHPFLYHSASGSKVVGELSSESLDKGGTVYLKFPLPVEDITIRLGVSKGYLTFYTPVSSTAPNSAVNDFILEIGTGCNDIYIDPRHTGYGIDSSMGQSVSIKCAVQQHCMESANLTFYVLCSLH